MNPLTEARTAVATAAEAAGLTTYPSPPEVITPPCAWITPDAQWLAPFTLAGVRVQLQLTAAVGTTGSNAAAAEALELQVWELWQQLAAAGIEVQELEQLTLNPDQTLATASLRVAVYVTPDETEGTQP